MAAERYTTGALLFLSAVMLAVLVPGGPIETRDFSHINPVALATFNTFLTVLGLVSVLIVYFVVRGARWASLVSAVCGISYLLVYVLDLGHLFPVSPNAMPLLLWFIEVAGTIIAVPLTYLSFQVARRRSVDAFVADAGAIRSYALLVALAIVVGIGIVIYATHAAMSGK